MLNQTALFALLTLLFLTGQVTAAPLPMPIKVRPKSSMPIANANAE